LVLFLDRATVMTPLTKRSEHYWLGFYTNHSKGWRPHTTRPVSLEAPAGQSIVLK